MSVEANKESVRRWNEEVYPAQFEAFDEFLHDDYTIHFGPWKGSRKDVEASFRQTLEEHPTAAIVVDDVVAEGDMVAVRRTTLENGQAVGIGMAFYRLADGKIIDDWWCAVDLEE